MKKHIAKSSFNEMEKDMNSISLFSGMLGLDLGLEAAGFNCRVATDINKDAFLISKMNFPDLPYLQADITTTSSETLLLNAKLKIGEVDLLAGGPPCQSFSKSGLRQGIEDKSGRGTLFKHYIRLLNEIQPKSFILENVRGILSSNKGEDWKDILSSFKETGYHVYWKVLDAANYGVPQFRQRLFIVGFKERLYFEFPKETHYDPEATKGNAENEMLPYTTVYDAIGDLQYSKDCSAYNGKYAHLLPEIPEGLNYSFYCKERGHSNPLFEWRSKFWYFLLKINRSRPSLTIQANPGNNTGPFHWENRRLGIKELKKLQTIPDWYKMLNSYSINHRLIGNAVPPLLGKLVGLQIRKALKENNQMSNLEYNELTCDESRSNEVKSGRGSGRGKFVVTKGEVVAHRKNPQITETKQYSLSQK